MFPQHYRNSLRLVQSKHKVAHLCQVQEESLSLSPSLLRSFFIVGNKGSPDAKGELSGEEQESYKAWLKASETEGERTKLGTRADCCSHELVMAERD